MDFVTNILKSSTLREEILSTREIKFPRKFINRKNFSYDSSESFCLIRNKKRIACDKIFPEKVVYKNVNNIVKTKFWFDKYNGNFGKMVETKIIE